MAKQTNGKNPVIRPVRTLALGLMVLALSGCGADTSIPAATASAPAASQAADSLKLVEPASNLVVSGANVTAVSVSGFDSSHNLVFGPQEQTYSATMNFTGLPQTTASVEVDYERAQGYTLGKTTAPVNFVSGASTVELDNLTPLVAQASAAPTFTVRIENTSAYPDDQVYVSVNGKNQAQSAFYYVQFGPNDVNTFQPFQGLAQSANYSQQLSALKSEGGHSYSFQCPYEDLVSGRIYLSFGKKLQGLGLNDLSNPLSLQLPSASGAPDGQTLYEFMELSATIPSDQSAPQVYTLFANTSVVDFFSIGLGMTLHSQLNGVDVPETVGFVNGARSQVLADFAAATTPVEFQNYVIKDGTSTILRVLAPVQAVAINPTGATSRFLDSAITSGWNLYASQVLNIPDTIPGRPYGYTWSGAAILNNILAMTCTSAPGGDVGTGALQSLGEVCHLPKPTSRIIFFCDDDQSLLNGTSISDTWKNAGSDGHRRLCSLLSSALNRGVFENYADWGNAAKFYTRPDGKYNHFSQIMHKYAINGKVYGFGYDDVYGQDPTLAQNLNNVNEIVITVPSVPVL